MRAALPFRRLVAAGTLVVAAVLVLAACGGDDAQPGVSPTPSAAPTADGLPEGTPVPELLSAVRCEPAEADDDASDDEKPSDDAAGEDAESDETSDSAARWIATGAVSNPSKNPVSFQVSVYVGAPGKKAAAATQELVDVKPDATVKFTLENVPAADPDGPCHVQLLSLPDD